MYRQGDFDRVAQILEAGRIEELTAHRIKHHIDAPASILGKPGVTEDADNPWVACRLGIADVRLGDRLGQPSGRDDANFVGMDLDVEWRPRSSRRLGAQRHSRSPRGERRSGVAVSHDAEGRSPPARAPARPRSPRSPRRPGGREAPSTRYGGRSRSPMADTEDLDVGLAGDRARVVEQVHRAGDREVGVPSSKSPRSRSRSSSRELAAPVVYSLDHPEALSTGTSARRNCPNRARRIASRERSMKRRRSSSPNRATLCEPRRASTRPFEV